MHNIHSSCFAGLLLLAAMSGCKEQSRQPETMLVDIVEATETTASRHSQYPGLTEAKDNADLAFKVLGTIERVLVREGDHVSRGQVLARIDNRDYAAQLTATESEYRQVKAECERVIAMHAEEAVSDNDYDKARSGLERISVKLKSHRDQLDDCQLRAPYDSYVSQIYRSAGESAGPGLAVVGIFTKGDIEVVINVPESEYRQARRSATYVATFATLPDRTFPLKLRSAAPQANGNHLFQLRLSLGAGAGELTPGMSAMVDIQHSGDSRTTGGDSRIIVPTGALFNDGGNTYVYVYDGKSGSIRRTPVTVESLCTDGHAIVTSGLHSGQQIVSSGVGKLTDGQQVKPLKPSSAENYGNLL